jgi:hypothetical protein
LSLRDTHAHQHRGAPSVIRGKNVSHRGGPRGGYHPYRRN